MSDRNKIVIHLKILLKDLNKNKEVYLIKV